MKVSSPVGTFLFTFDKIRLHGSRITVHGHMGAWPSEIEVGIEDVPKTAWLALGAVTLVSALAVSRRRATSR
ncbi:hypothetical protein [Acrocarpospora sp. B8E8]|uniref:hypothetical protein n=1 Tax=Acrocarpospora sp. B8E8 TaxID=3153572 RepID=UPI00325E86B4